MGRIQNILVSYLGMLLNDYIFTWTNFAGINLRWVGRDRANTWCIWPSAPIPSGPAASLGSAYSFDRLPCSIAGSLLYSYRQYQKSQYKSKTLAACPPPFLSATSYTCSIHAVDAENHSPLRLSPPPFPPHTHTHMHSCASMAGIPTST